MIHHLAWRSHAPTTPPRAPHAQCITRVADAHVYLLEWDGCLIDQIEHVPMDLDDLNPSPGSTLSFKKS